MWYNPFNITFYGGNRMRKISLRLRKAAALFVSAALLICAAPQAFLSAASADGAEKFEFESGKLTDCENGFLTWAQIDEDAEGNVCDLSGYSGTGFAYIDRKGAKAELTVNVAEAGLYELLISYVQCFDTNRKIQNLYVNGVSQGEVCFPYNSKEGWSLLSAGYIPLNKGDNTVMLESYWGYTMLDYVTLKKAPESVSTLKPERKLTNPDSSDATKRLFNYLCDCYGNSILSGQQEYVGSHNYNINADEQAGKEIIYIKDNEAEFDYIKETTGELPAIRGIDFLTYSSNNDYQDYAAERAIEWTNRNKGIVTVCWHWSVPSTEGSSDIAFYVESASASFTTFSISKALTEGTWENKSLMADIKLIASQLQKLKDKDVPVIWRPLHEAEGAWFWWGAEGPEYCKQLYRLLYQQLTEVYGLNNLIWEWTSSTYPTSPAWYPGDDVVDIVSCDKYNSVDDYTPDLSAIPATFYSLVASTNGKKMVAMSENDSIPSVGNLINDKAGWLYFCPWYMTYLTSEQLNPADNLKEIYTSDYCITLDELPDLKSYTLDGYGGGEEPDFILGDVTGDGKVNVQDVAKLAKAALSLVTLTQTEKKAGDVNGDGVINVQDVAKVAKAAIGKIKL